MKKICVMLGIAAVLASCGGGDKKETTQTATNVAAHPDYQAGLELVGKSDCLTCHKVSATSTGPSYKAVAEKYTATPENIDMLAQKIIAGGVGNWGQVPMSAHPDMSKEDAQKMVKYILLLK